MSVTTIPSHAPEPALDAVRETLPTIVAEFLNLVEDTSDPAGIAQHLLDTIHRDQLRDLCTQHDVRLHPADGPNAHLLEEGLFVTISGGRRVFIVPLGQSPGETLAQLREALAQAGLEMRAIPRQPAPAMP